MQTVVGLYDRFEDAQQCVHALTDSGFDSNHISMIASDNEGKYSRYLEGDMNQKQNLGEGTAAGAGIGAVLGGLGGLLLGLGALAIPGIGPVIAAGPIAAGLAGAGVGAVAGGVVGALVNLGVPEEHAKSYAEGIRHGGTLVTVQTDQERAAEAQMIMNRFNPIDIDSRTAQWQGESGMSESGQQTRMDRTAMPMSSAIPVTGDDDMNNSDIPVTGRQNDTTIPILEEDLRVGKRQVESGGVRAEAHIEETPVEEDINLRQEHVNVERRPVDRPATEADFDAFKEGTFEMRETKEEPVVEKRARVVEEVNLNKDVEEETHTIRDTVRHTEVDVQKMNPSGMSGAMDWNTYEQGFRSDFQTRYQGSRYGYSDFQPAYRSGYDLGMNQQYRGYDWNRMEPIARSQWEQSGSRTAWDEVKDSVRHAWQTVSRR